MQRLLVCHSGAGLVVVVAAARAALVFSLWRSGCHAFVQSAVAQLILVTCFGIRSPCNQRIPGKHADRLFFVTDHPHAHASAGPGSRTALVLFQAQARSNVELPCCVGKCSMLVNALLSIEGSVVAVVALMTDVPASNADWPKGRESVARVHHVVCDGTMMIV